MLSPITRNGILLKYSPEVVQAINQVIDANLDKPALLALFISRLLKGLQNLTNEDYEVFPSWGLYQYEIQDIGVVSFKLYCDLKSETLAFAVDSIRWTFSTSRFFLGVQVLNPAITSRAGRAPFGQQPKRRRHRSLDG